MSPSATRLRRRQIALAWVMAQAEIVVPIPGSTKLAHVESNLAAGGVQLDDADAEELDAMPQPVGNRY